MAGSTTACSTSGKHNVTDSKPEALPQCSQPLVPLLLLLQLSYLRRNRVDMLALQPRAIHVAHSVNILQCQLCHPFPQLQRTHWPGDDTDVISFDPEACSPLCKQGQLCQPHVLLQRTLT